METVDDEPDGVEVTLVRLEHGICERVQDGIESIATSVWNAMVHEFDAYCSTKMSHQRRG